MFGDILNLMSFPNDVQNNETRFLPPNIMHKFVRTAFTLFLLKLGSVTYAQNGSEKTVPKAGDKDTIPTHLYDGTPIPLDMRLDALKDTTTIDYHSENYDTVRMNPEFIHRLKDFSENIEKLKQHALINELVVHSPTEPYKPIKKKSLVIDTHNTVSVMVEFEAPDSSTVITIVKSKDLYEIEMRLSNELIIINLEIINRELVLVSVTHWDEMGSNPAVTNPNDANKYMDIINSSILKLKL